MKLNKQNQISRFPDGDSVYLIRQMGLGLVKQAINEGLMKVASPKTADEAEQISDFKKELDNCKCEKDSLRFALMFNKVLVDDGVIHNNYLFHSLSSDEYDDHRPLIENITDDIHSIFDFISSSKEGLNVAAQALAANGKFGKSEQEASKLRIDIADNLSLLEPLLWDGWCQGGTVKPGINRNVLRDILDLIVAFPEILWMVRNTSHDSDEWNDPGFWRDPLEPLAKKYNLTDKGILEFRRLVSLTEVKGRVALSYAEKSSQEKAILPLWDFPIGESRNPNGMRWINIRSKDDILVAIHLFLEEVEFLPKLESFKDLINLKSDLAFKDFRHLLIQWAIAIMLGDIISENKIRKEIRSANQSLKTAAKCERVGGWLTYFTIPLIIAEAAVLPGIGYIAGIAGFGLKAVADWQKHANKWLILARGGKI